MSQVAGHGCEPRTSTSSASYIFFFTGRLRSIGIGSKTAIIAGIAPSLPLWGRTLCQCSLSCTTGCLVAGAVECLVRRFEYESPPVCCSTSALARHWWRMLGPGTALTSHIHSPVANDRLPWLVRWSPQQLRKETSLVRGPLLLFMRPRVRCRCEHWCEYLLGVSSSSNNSSSRAKNKTGHSALPRAKLDRLSRSGPE